MIIAAHISVILLAYSSPFWLDWRLLVLGIALYYLQIFIFGGCGLSLAQFKGEKKSFHQWYLEKLGFRPDPARLSFFLDRILPFILLGIALTYQLILGYRPFITF